MKILLILGWQKNFIIFLLVLLTPTVNKVSSPTSLFLLLKMYPSYPVIIYKCLTRNEFLCKSRSFCSSYFLPYLRRLLHYWITKFRNELLKDVIMIEKFDLWPNWFGKSMYYVRNSLYEVVVGILLDRCSIFNSFFHYFSLCFQTFNKGLSWLVQLLLFM